jgi:hypothetical protein
MAMRRHLEWRTFSLFTWLRGNTSIWGKNSPSLDGWSAYTAEILFWWRGRFSGLGDSQTHPVVGMVSFWPVRYEAARSGVCLESLPSNGLYRTVRLVLLGREPVDVGKLAESIALLFNKLMAILHSLSHCSGHSDKFLSTWWTALTCGNISSACRASFQWKDGTGISLRCRLKKTGKASPPCVTPACMHWRV